MTNAEAWFNVALRPQKPQGSLGRKAQDGHLDFHTAPELWELRCCTVCWSRGSGFSVLSDRGPEHPPPHWTMSSTPILRGVATEARVPVSVISWTELHLTTGPMSSDPILCDVVTCSWSSSFSDLLDRAPSHHRASVLKSHLVWCCYLQLEFQFLRRLGQSSISPPGQRPQILPCVMLLPAAGVPVSVVSWTELPNTHSTTDRVLKFHLVAVVEENPP